MNRLLPVKELAIALTEELKLDGLTDEKTIRVVKFAFSRHTPEDQQTATQAIEQWLRDNQPTQIIQRLVTLTGSRAAAAGKLGVDAASISRYLSGKTVPSVPVVKLAQLLLAADTTNNNK